MAFEIKKPECALDWENPYCKSFIMCIEEAFNEIPNVTAGYHWNGVPAVVCPS